MAVTIFKEAELELEKVGLLVFFLRRRHLNMSDVTRVKDLGAVAYTLRCGRRRRRRAKGTVSRDVAQRE
jgi:hypothetical protein